MTDHNNELAAAQAEIARLRDIILRDHEYIHEQDCPDRDHIHRCSPAECQHCWSAQDQRRVAALAQSSRDDALRAYGERVALAAKREAIDLCNHRSERILTAKPLRQVHRHFSQSSAECALIIERDLDILKLIEGMKP
ncbi:hypothetical protein [Chitinolyticbacter meiyuanensis]|uniref:hypothetical protein n=1 Tax=Chitinolyticbacter meiyuanensis TaxID=682798 RepID=UPI0011E5EF57|nr:hypothetical protein [Chitinolyticbacter meiyuanensis]